MATASVMQVSRSVLHVRGNWSAREDRVPSAVWLAILWVGMIAGFGLDIPRVAKQSPPVPTVTWVHAVVFSVWMFLLTAQVLLVLRDRVALHRKLGWFAAGWAGLMCVLGPWAAISVQIYTKDLPPQFLSVNLVDMVGFVALLAWAIALRKNPAAHRRMMILATISLADPGFARITLWLWPSPPSSVIPWFFQIFYGNVLLIALMAAWDWWRGRLVRSFVIGAVGLLAGEFACALLFFWGPWINGTTAFVAACARHAG